MMQVGVIGAGVMGTGLTQDLVAHGFGVVLIDRSAETLASARRDIEGYGRFSRLLGGGQGSASQDTGDYDANLSRVVYSTDLNTVAAADFVVENITEDWALKKEVYPVIDEACPEDTVFAANTSAIPITKLAALTSRPDRIVGMHFMNPVPMKKAVEVIRGWHTSDETLKRADQLLTGLGKKGITVADSPGFVSNRVLMLTVNEAVYLVHEGVATAADVDEVFRSCFGHKMGPLETADLIGLDTILYSIEVLQESFADSKYRPCPLLKKMVDAGLYGRKSGQGFYSYR
ncbi:MAG: 3-hydroxyacyl-CoA dehydrogenase NAD-binding domain-containing protein [Streptosporangiaceae bacterium]